MNSKPATKLLPVRTGSASSDREIKAAEIDAAAEATAGCYEELPPAAKAQTVKLAHALADLRRKMVTPNDKTEPRGGMNPQAANPKGTP